jgi:hypothetical protein
MAVTPGRTPGLYVVQFQQGGIRVFERLPPGTTLKQARDLETKLRREIFDEVALDRQPELTLPAAFGQWITENRRKSQDSVASEARSWQGWIEGKSISEAPEIAERAIKSWLVSGKRPRKAGGEAGPAKATTINRRLAFMRPRCGTPTKRGGIR